MTQATPPEPARLEQLLGSAFDELPEPDAFQLKRIEERLTDSLSRKVVRRRPLRFWWIIGALATSGAAAWWAGEMFRMEDSAAPGLMQQRADGEETPRAEKDDSGVSEETPLPADDHDRSTDPKRSPNVIYRRESY